MATLEELYREAYEITNAVCARCPVPFKCCEPAGCRQAMAWSREVRRAALTPASDGDMPFLSAAGCTLAPHLRPLCTLWVCGRAERPARLMQLVGEIAEAEREALRIGRA